jgi:two-component system sensor histidine kinase KdpD
MSERSKAVPWRAIAIVLATLALGTLVVAALEAAGIDDASAVYLLAVVATGVAAGTWPAVASAIGAFVLFDLLFVEPRYTLTVDDPQEWLDLALLLAVGVIVGRLAGRARERAETALASEREAQAMLGIGFALASTTDVQAALPAVVDGLRAAVPCTRLWVEVGERVVAGTGDGPRGAPAVQTLLGRRPGSEPAEWTRVHVPTAAGRRGAEAATSLERHRVAIAVAEGTLGAIVLDRDRRLGHPDAGETRVLAAAADQLGRALDRERLATDAAAAEIARRGDVLKSALLDSVSHDLRTPLASIRAAAGTLMDPDFDRSAEDRAAIAGSIDLEAERLNRLVSNLLDLSRIEAGELKPSISAFLLDDLVERAIGRSALARAQDRLRVEVPPDLPPVEVDEVLFDQVLANVFENAERYAGPDATIRVGAEADAGEDAVRLTVEDAGPGVSDDALPRLFEKFYRAPRSREEARRGTGTGLSVVRGLVQAMDGSVTARRSELGGLAIDLVIPTARRPPSIGDDVAVPA